MRIVSFTSNSLGVIHSKLTMFATVHWIQETELCNPWPTIFTQILIWFIEEHEESKDMYLA